MSHLRENKDSGTTMFDDADNWEDIRFPFIGRNVDVINGRIDYNYVENTIDFTVNSRYPEEPLALIAQMPHSKVRGSMIHPHLHWAQNQDELPNWLMAYRWYNNGEACNGAYTFAKPFAEGYEYTSGTMMQNSFFPGIVPPEYERLSSCIDILLYRDFNDVSGLFKAQDRYSGSAAAKSFDVHYTSDSFGSGTKRLEGVEGLSTIEKRLLIDTK